MDQLDLFPAVYARSREGFLAESSAAGAELESHVHPLRGPDDEILAMDVATFGDPTAKRVLVVSSGTHGVEGRCGAGIQRSLLATTSFRELPPNVRVILVHAVNPWGFAHDRRVDHENVDVNRNFVDHDRYHPENAAYEALYDLLNPKVLEADGWAGKLTAYAVRKGQNALFFATMGGQYKHPQGVQFGGTKQCWSNKMVRTFWEKHVAGAEVAIAIDLHTGLGRKGAPTILQTADADEPRAELARTTWSKVKRYDRPTDGNVIATGALTSAFETESGAQSALAITLEFGTIPPARVYGALRADNWLEHHAERRSALGREIARRMRAAFFVDDPEWRWKVLEGGQGIIFRAIDGLSKAETWKEGERVRPKKLGWKERLEERRARKAEGDFDTEGG